MTNRDQGKNKVSIFINDGEALIIDSVFTKFTENSIEENFETVNLASVILRSFDSDSNNTNDLKKYVHNLVINGVVDYWTINPSNVITDYTYVFELVNSEFDLTKINGFRNYYHTLFKNKTARTLLFNKTLDFVEVMCKTYPSDFKERTISELESLFEFTNSIKLITYNDEIEFEKYWEGFIVRRHFIDNVPILEIQNSILESIKRLKSINQTNSFNALYEININNQLNVFYSGHGTYITSFTSDKKYKFNDNESIKSIRFLKDLSGDYYQITTNIASVEKKYLFSKNLLLINKI